MKLWRSGRIAGAMAIGAAALMVAFVGMAGVAHGQAGGGAAFLLAHDDDDRDDRDHHADRHVRSFMFDGAYLGVFLEGSRRGGAGVAKVVEDSPAEAAGLRKGDVVIGVDGEEVDSARDLTRHIDSLEPGDEVELEVRRDGDTLTLVAELDERDGPMVFSFGDGDFDFDFDFDFSDLEDSLEELEEHLGSLEFHMPHAFTFEMGSRRPRLGVQVLEATPELRTHLGGPDDAGVLVGKVLPDSPAEEAGLEVGDLIVRADDRKVRGHGDLIRALQDRDGETIVLEVIRDGRTVTLDAFLPENDDEEEPRRGPARHERRPAEPSSQRA